MNKPEKKRATAGAAKKKSRIKPRAVMNEAYENVVRRLEGKGNGKAITDVVKLVHLEQELSGSAGAPAKVTNTAWGKENKLTKGS